MAALADLTLSERAILSLIRRHPGASRAGIAAQLNLSPAMLTKAIATFQVAGLVAEERDSAPRGRGQPVRHLHLRPKQVAGLGVSLSTRGITVAAQDLDGTPLAHRSLPVPATDTRAALAATTAALEEMRGLTRSVAGIGLWLPALQDLSGAVVEVTPSQRGIDHAAFCDHLSRQFQAPLWLESKAPAYHEALQPGEEERIVYMLFLDYGIGGSLIDQLRLYRGSFGEASNIGAMMPDGTPRPSLPDLTAHLGLSPDEMTDGALEALAQAPDPALTEWMATRGAVLSLPLSTVVHLLNPAAIIIGGLLPQAILDGLARHVRLDLLDHPGRRPLTKPELRVARACGPGAMALAAASVPLVHRLASAPHPRPWGAG